MPGPTPARWTNIPAIFSSLLCLATTSKAFLAVPYNTTQSFGPDGPWQAISIGLKYSTDTDYSTVNLYPGNLYNTIAAFYVPTRQACRKDTTGTCAEGGAVAPVVNASSHAWYTYLNAKTGYYLYYNGTVSTMDAQLPQGVIYSDVYVDVCKIADITYPSGKTVAAEVGLANLGGSPLATNLSPPGALYSSSTIQSNTFGLHIGSAQHNYPGSLIFGGYDRGRVIGPVLSFDAHTAPHLLDINIGVEDGASPFSFESKGKLLQAPDSAGVTQPISAYLKPEYPYIYLPKLTIEAIAENLPVKFDTTSGYWLWDTSDPMYKKVIGGANYLGFTFPSLTGNTANETIKVPFALLNLTLESSVSGLGSDVPYFPLMEAEVSQLTGYPILLGRAFMQATFTGTNWNTNMSWLAQAPGPGASREGLGYDPVDLGDSTQNLDVPSGDALFKESWAAHWTVLNTTDPGNGNDDNGGGGVSGGVIGGSVVAAAGGVAIIAAIIFFVMRRRKRKAASPQATQNAYHDHSPGPPAPTYAHYGDAQQPMSELHAPAQNEYYKPVPQQEQWHEMEAREYHAELPGHAPAELPASHK